ncbi:MAG: T9SS type A sorting domain-containing protein [Marinilabiliaceae bacterium]|nr:T9SS type A sorting domain-containing protein [Marinilabiliaceae bacterium]
MNKKIFFTLAFLIIGKSLVNSQSPYISKVFEYRPAPGQFVNMLPQYEVGDTQADMDRKAEESISDDNGVLISLGGYGGYIIFGFDHPVINVPGAYDFKILGNAIISTPPGATRDGGNCEPGIVLVSYDLNGNGIPDDQWYELAGSEYFKPETVNNYHITYFKPDENKIPTPDPNYPFLSDTTYIKWTDNQGDEGYISRNVFHSHPYYPQWIDAETLFFEGNKLANNYLDLSGTGSLFVQYAYPWGYADNYPNTDERSNFNIEWAVDSNGNSVFLPAIHFVKVYTAVNQYCGWLGETSTEIMGAEDLHPHAVYIKENQINKTILLIDNPAKEFLIIVSYEQQNIDIYDYLGRKQFSFELKSGTNYIPCGQLSNGIHLIKNENFTVKFVKL